MFIASEPAISRLAGQPDSRWSPMRESFWYTACTVAYIRCSRRKGCVPACSTNRPGLTVFSYIRHVKFSRFNYDPRVRTRSIQQTLLAQVPDPECLPFKMFTVQVFSGGSSTEKSAALTPGADPGSGRCGARPSPGRRDTSQFSPFNSIQTPVQHWATFPVRNPASATGPISPKNDTLHILARVRS